MENPIKMDDLGGPPLFLETPKSYKQNIQKVSTKHTNNQQRTLSLRLLHAH